MARPRTPTHILELRGSFTKHPERRREREREAEGGGAKLPPGPPLSGVPPPPGWLSPYARTEWDTLAPLAVKTGRLNKLNISAFEHMCVQRGLIASGSVSLPRSVLSQCRAFERAFGVAPRRAP